VRGKLTARGTRKKPTIFFISNRIFPYPLMNQREVYDRNAIIERLGKSFEESIKIIKGLKNIKVAFVKVYIQWVWNTENR
jgi:hypothetical protein